jgi:hypothetical protein
MLPVRLITDNQILNSRVHGLPVRVESLTSFVLPSKTRPELRERHRVTFDSGDRPRAFSCTCEAYARGLACWAAARALDVLTLLLANNVTVGGPDGPGEEAPTTSTGAEGGDAPATGRELPGARFVCRRTHKAPAPEGNPEAVLAAPIRRVGRVEKVKGFTI